MPGVAGGLRRALRFGLIGMGWAVVAVLGLVSAFHIVHREPWTAVVALIAVTPWLYMPAWVSASAGLFYHRPILAICSLGLVALQLWWVLPDFDPVSHLAPLARGDVGVRLYDVNVSQSNRNLDEIAGEIRRDHAQVVTMEELTPVALRSLQTTGVMAPYRYQLVRPTTGSYGMGIWAVYPLADAVEWRAEGHPELRAWLELPKGRRLRIDVLHNNAPVGGDEPAVWADQLDIFRTELAHEPRPLVAVGDFNATWYDWHFQALLHLGMRDAAVVAGQGWRMTWPRDQEPVVPYARIDHVLISRGVSLESYGVGGGRGSDHHPLLVRLGVG